MNKGRQLFIAKHLIFIIRATILTKGNLKLSKKSNGISNKQFKELLKSIRNIESKLDVLVSLQKASAPKPKIGKEEQRILKLCDKKHTIADMIQETQKKEGTINATLNHLKAKGLMQTVKVDDKIVYERIR